MIVPLRLLFSMVNVFVLAAFQGAFVQQIIVSLWKEGREQREGFIIRCRSVLLECIRFFFNFPNAHCPCAIDGFVQSKVECSLQNLPFAIMAAIRVLEGEE